MHHIGARPDEEKGAGPRERRGERVWAVPTATAVVLWRRVGSRTAHHTSIVCRLPAYSHVVWEWAAPIPAYAAAGRAGWGQHQAAHSNAHQYHRQELPLLCGSAASSPASASGSYSGGRETTPARTRNAVAASRSMLAGEARDARNPCLSEQAACSRAASADSSPVGVVQWVPLRVQARGSSHAGTGVDNDA